MFNFLKPKVRIQTVHPEYGEPMWGYEFSRVIYNDREIFKTGYYGGGSLFEARRWAKENEYRY